MERGSIFPNVDSSSFFEKFVTDIPDLKDYDSRKLDKTEITHALRCMIQKKPVVKLVREALRFEKLSDKDANSRSYVDLQSLPKKMYLEDTIVPALTDGLVYVATERPVSPIHALACFLLRNISTYERTKDLNSTRSKYSVLQSQSRVASSKSRQPAQQTQ